ncbi:MAG: segregation/condensation protein A [Acidobacteriota bacterium]
MATVDYRVRLEIFEGPLDLLLHLIRTQEIDIYDIPIAKITEQYLEYLELMRDLNISVAGEFLVMAATLIHIKSRMLLPPDPAAEEGEEAEDPRRELVERLLEHERFKKAAGLLHDRHVLSESSWVRGHNEFEEEEQEAVSVSLFDLVQAFHRVVERHRRNIVMEVGREGVTLEEKIAEVRRLLALHRELMFSFFLQRPIPRLHLIVLFVALLELARCREVRLLQTAAFDDIRIVAC